ncbi:glutamate receptor ionotropic, kainate 2-like, partial [Aphidius gifuensis]|uniref:glutamate receptor ionotropic, kainate 2-like n=1 Tax=Aphidius gifuensis TaxID=684658 RepID=UPI001CDC9E24
IVGLSSVIDDTTGKFIKSLTSSIHSSASITAFFCIKTGVVIINNNKAVEVTKIFSQYSLIADIHTSFDNYNFDNVNLQIAHQHYYVIDFDCNDAVSIIKLLQNYLKLQANMKRMFVAPFKWLIINDQNMSITNDIEDDYYEKNKSSLFSVFKNINIYPDSEVFIGQREIINNTFKLLSLYRPSFNHDLIIENRGSWNYRNGLVLTNHDSSSRRRRDLKKTPLKSCLVMTNPDTLNHLTDYKNKLVDAVTKANYPWIIHLVNRINATVNFTVRDTWGYKDKNGSWNGMIGLLDSGEIDIGGTGTFLIPERIGVVDYVQLYTPTGSKFLFRRPPLSYVSNLFTLPFSRSVWLAIVIFLFLVCCLLFITMKWEFNLSIKNNNPMSYYKTIKPTISDNFLVILGAVSQQGFSYEATIISTRIIIFMVLLATLSLYAAYTANIVALLQSTTDSIKTLTDLMNSPLKIGIYDIVYSRYILSTIEEPVRKEFYEKMVKGNEHVWMSLTEGIQKLRQGLFAFHVEVGAGYQLIQETFEEDEKCGINEIDIFNLLNPLLVIKRQSPYRELIRVGAMWIHETGLQKRDIRRLYTEKPTCVGGTSFVSVGITECYAAISTLFYGAALTFIIFIIEIIWKKW